MIIYARIERLELKILLHFFIHNIIMIFFAIEQTVRQIGHRLHEFKTQNFVEWSASAAHRSFVSDKCKFGPRFRKLEQNITKADQKSRKLSQKI